MARTNILLAILAIFIGVVTALLVALYKHSIEQLFGFCAQGGEWLFIAPAIGGVLTGVWLWLFGLRQSPDTERIAAYITSDEKKPTVKDSIVSIVGSIFTLGSGGSLGPEVPSAQIGAASALYSNKLLKLKEEHIKTLVGCGVAAGISAAFNAPLAGFIFVIEIIYRNLPRYTLAIIMLASVSSAVTTELMYGRTPAFNIPVYSFLHTYELFLYLLLGIFSAFIIVFFKSLNNISRRQFDKLSIPLWTKPAIGGLFVGVIGFFISADVLGVGYSAIESMLLHEWSYFIFVLLAGKILATALTAASGGQGGLIAPALFIGAAFGSGFGMILQDILTQATPSAYGLVGMGAMLAGLTGAPILGIILPFEMTQDYRIILPLTICVVSTHLTLSFFEEKRKQK